MEVVLKGQGGGGYGEEFWRFCSKRSNGFSGELAILAIWTCQTTSSRMLQDDDQAIMMQRHGQWMAQYGKAYKSMEEKEKRFKIFKNNVELIEANNKDGNRPYKLSINEFADLTNEEFKASRNGFKKPSQRGSLEIMTSFKYQNVVDVPSSIDWRTKGAVTPVKNQGQCGSCWAFSVIAATEGITKLTTGKLVSLSEQELVDCDRSGEDQGCEGGYMEDGFEFIVKNNGIAGEAGYPYKAVDSTCNKKDESPVAATIKGYEKVPANSEAALLKAVANQPISVSIDASGFDFQFYSSGVFTGQCGTDLDHGVTAVGYGTNGTMNYWLVKNSWGTSWGEEGYIRMQRDVTAKGGICGIAMDASYPTN
ncbi:hypothetical protein Leryth_012800 [Lithospermum erythrorhizon]|uniref:Cysteine protease n=1 Tax=Lithospermum erythrorhizon TaxID=34254 RepID=A0AAV3Q952_LITER|nr:hypothetical protein Leryth_012800 [Lithospermum erythrorhizon]